MDESLRGKGEKKAPGLLKSNANHFFKHETPNRATGANALCHGSTFFLLFKK